MSQYIPEIVSALLSLIVGWILIKYQGRAKIIFWQPHGFRFQNISKEKVIIKTETISIRNTGSKPAKSVEIVHEKKPDHFELAPFILFEEVYGPNKEHVIRLSYLGPKETVNLQILSYKEKPKFVQIRSEAGTAKLQYHVQTPYFSKTMIFLAQFLMLLGFSLIVYTLIKISIYLIPLVF